MSLAPLIRWVERELLDGGAVELPPPCSEAQISQLVDLVRTEFGAILPTSYLDVLKQRDGLGYDGTNLLASGLRQSVDADDFPAIGGIIEYNRSLIKDDAGIPDQVCLAADGVFKFCADVSGKHCAAFDLYGRRVQDYASFELMFRRMFRIPPGVARD